MSLLFDWRKAVAASELTPTQRLVALVLSLHMGTDGDSCYPSLKTLSAESGLSRPAVSKAIEALEQGGFISCERGGGRAHPNRYRAVLPEEQVATLPVGKGQPRGGKQATSRRETGKDVATRSSGERQRERPPQPPKGGEQHRGADAHEEDRLAALDIDPRPFGVEEGASDAAR